MVNTNIYKLQYIPTVDNLADFFTKIMNKQRHDYLVSFIVHREKMLSMKITNTKVCYRNPSDNG